MSGAARARVLLADDDRLVRAIFGDALRADGHEVVLAPDGLAALHELEAAPFDLLVTDLLMPGLDGLQLLERAKALRPQMEAIVLTSVGTAEPAVAALRAGAFHYLVKPLDPEALQLEVRRCLESRRLVDENRALRRSHDLLLAAQRITGCLEPERLHPLATQTLAAILGCEAVLLVRPAEHGGLEHLAVHGMPTGAAHALADRLMATHGPALAAGPEPIPLADTPTPGLLMPLLHGGRAYGAAVLLAAPPRRGFSAVAMREAAFLAEALALALENAGHFLRARLVAHLDPLTGLHNAAYLEHALDREIRNRAEAVRPFGVLFMDLDHFKRVNDTHGHLVGSRVLVEMGRLLRRCTREGDVLIRYGGDEFVVILPEATPETARCAAERIRATVEGHRFLAREGLNLSLTVCVGVCAWPEHASTREDMIHRADLAMYHGKKGHRNAVYTYDALPATPVAGAAPARGPAPDRV